MSTTTLDEHTRTITWHDAEAARGRLAGKTGLEVMQGIRDGTLPPPPMARVIGFRCIVAEPGEVAMQLDYDPSLENAIGMLHGGVAASMLDTAMGAAANTLLPAASGAVTLDLSITYLRPATPASAPITATGKVVNLGRTVAYVTGEVTDAKGRLVAHAVGNFSVLAARPGT
jgi:uncharacterized protein (TIGR00369 family)